MRGTRRAIKSTEKKTSGFYEELSCLHGATLPWITKSLSCGNCRSLRRFWTWEGFTSSMDGTTTYLRELYHILPVNTYTYIIMNMIYVYVNKK